MTIMGRAGTRVARGALLAVLGITMPGGIASLGPAGAEGQQGDLEARIWLDRSSDALYERGDRARVYYRVSEGAYVAIFRIDTDGRIRLLHPRSPYQDDYARGGQDYRLLFSEGRSAYWLVDDDPGKGYYFIVASPEPLDFSTFEYAAGGGWDLASVGRTVYGDPYVAIDDYVARLIPDWEVVPYALDFTEYNVDRVYEYPRFLCYDCHHYRPYGVWNPYGYHCTSFRVVIFNDPYYYPVYRYRGTRVVFVRPPRPRQPRFVFKERAAGESWRPVVATRGPAGTVDVPRRVAPKETPTGRGSGTGDGVSRRAGGAAPPAAPRREVPARAADPALAPRLRPSDPVRSGSGSAGDSGGERASPAVGPVLPTRRSTPPASATPVVKPRPSSTGESPARPAPSARPSPTVLKPLPPGRGSAPVRKPPTAAPSSPRAAPPASRTKRSKPSVKKRGGGGPATVGELLAAPDRKRVGRGRRNARRPSASLRRVLEGVLGASGSVRRLRAPAAQTAPRVGVPPTLAGPRQVPRARASTTRSSVGGSGGATVPRAGAAASSSTVRRSPPVKVKKASTTGKRRGGGR